MSPETWEKVKAGFNTALDMNAGQRAEFVARLESEVRHEVERMLAAQDENGGAFREPIVDLEAIGGRRLPERIGDYRIEREIGSGGMGTVYEAWRETETFRQRVALKVVRSGIDIRTVLHRFRSEQKILASLEHPNISRFLDGGTTTEGLPFYAMEFVEGMPIDEYCQAHDLDLNAKLELFRKVCSALSYAHSRLIVHRDLKPSNILVTKDGTPKLLDFGIAKVLENEFDGHATATQFGLMTPQYASPEQVRGESVTVMSDVYSLGLLLYEIIVGEKPYVTNGRSLADVLEVVTKTQPVKPSVTAAALGNRSSIGSEIDTIVMKALQKDPVRRYPSVEQLSEDLHRFLAGLPISARPDSVSYRSKKFVGRHRLGIAAGLLVFVTLVTGIVFSASQAIKAQQQQRLAEKRFYDVRALANNVVFRYHDEIAKLEGSTAVREMLVTDATAYLDNLSADATDDTDLLRELALAYTKLGDVQGRQYTANTGNTHGAFQSYTKAVNLLEIAMRLSPEDTEIKDSFLTANDALIVLMARLPIGVLEKQGAISRSVDVLEKLRGDSPDDPRRLSQLATTYIRFGDSIGSIESRDALLEKLAFHEKALPLTQRLFDQDPNSANYIRAFARSNQRIGTDYIWLGENAQIRNQSDEAIQNFALALPYHRRMFDAVEQLVRLFPDDIETRRYEFAALSSYAETLARNEQRQEALTVANKALTIAVRLQQRDPNNREAPLDIAFIHEVLGKIYRFSGDLVLAINHTQRAVAICEDMLRADNGNNEAKSKAGDLYKELSSLHTMKGDLAKASTYDQKFVDLQSRG